MIPDLFLPVEICFLIDMILLAPFSYRQPAGFAFHDPLPPDIDHGFMLRHDHIDIAHLIQSFPTESNQVFGFPKTDMVTIRLPDQTSNAQMSQL